MNLERLEEKNLVARENHDARPADLVIVKSTLRELFELLEEYAPVWYTEEHHNRAVAALRTLQRP